MAQNITLLGASYSDVPAVLLPKTGGGTSQFDDTTDANATAADIASGKTAYVNGVKLTGTGSGGGGIGTLLKTTIIGTISTSSTTATDTGVDVTVTGINDYDMLIVETSLDATQANKHAATTRIIFWSSTNRVAGYSTLVSEVWNCRMNNTNTIATVKITPNSYGVYPYDCSISSEDNGTATMNMYQRYNSTNTGTINGTYTTRVYGVNLYDLIGG